MYENKKQLLRDTDLFLKQNFAIKYVFLPEHIRHSSNYFTNAIFGSIIILD